MVAIFRGKLKAKCQSMAPKKEYEERKTKGDYNFLECSGFFCPEGEIQSEILHLSKQLGNNTNIECTGGKANVMNQHSDQNSLRQIMQEIKMKRGSFEFCHAVKGYSRACVTSEENNSLDGGNIRTIEWLHISVDHLMHQVLLPILDIIACSSNNEYNEWILTTSYNFIMDRIKSIRQDLIRQEISSEEDIFSSILLLEKCLYIYILMGYLLSEQSLPHFDLHLYLGDLRVVNVLLGELHDMYYFDYCVQQMNTVNGKGIEGNLNRNNKSEYEENTGTNNISPMTLSSDRKICFKYDLFLAIRLFLPYFASLNEDGSLPRSDYMEEIIPHMQDSTKTLLVPLEYKIQSINLTKSKNIDGLNSILDPHLNYETTLQEKKKIKPLGIHSRFVLNVIKSLYCQRYHSILDILISTDMNRFEENSNSVLFLEREENFNVHGKYRIIVLIFCLSIVGRIRRCILNTLTKVFLKRECLLLPELQRLLRLQSIEQVKSYCELLGIKIEEGQKGSSILYEKEGENSENSGKNHQENFVNLRSERKFSPENYGLEDTYAIRKWRRKILNHREHLDRVLLLKWEKSFFTSNNCQSESIKNIQCEVNQNILALRHCFESVYRSL